MFLILDSMLLLLLEFFLVVLDVVGSFAIAVDTMCYMPQELPVHDFNTFRILVSNFSRKHVLQVIGHVQAKQTLCQRLK